ncbi:type 1 glutamine amidotransferase domain-containing protein, partial [Bacillus sp. SS-TM]
NILKFFIFWEVPNISRNIYENGGIVSSVCHGAAGLFHITLSNGDRLISGKKVTGFSNEEEKLAELDQFVPFLTEDELIKNGGLYEKAAQPWEAYALEDNRVITGQNPASGGPVAELVLKQLQK